MRRWVVVAARPPAEAIVPQRICARRHLILPGQIIPRTSQAEGKLERASRLPQARRHGREAGISRARTGRQ